MQPPPNPVSAPRSYGRFVAFAVGVAVAALLARNLAPAPAPVESQPPVAATPAAASPPARSIGRAATWPRLFGPLGDGRAVETSGTLDTNSWTAEGPPELWRRAIGRGYSAPVVDDGRVVLFHRTLDRERLTAFSLATGEPLWDVSDPTEFRCRYEYSDGPYATPWIDGDRVYSVGARALLSCRRTTDGGLLWQRDLHADFQLRDGPFGFGAQLFVDDRRVVLNVGGREAGVVAFDKATGRTLWTATDHGAAYTAPLPVRRGELDLLVVLTDFGLACLDRRSGRLYDELPFRSRVADSVSGVTPVADGARLLVVGGRGPGAAGIEVGDQGELRTVWRAPKALDSLFNTLVLHQGCVYGFTSSRSGAASLRCLEFASGRVCWSHTSELERGQAAALGDSLLVLGEHGHLAAFKLDPARCDLRRQTAEPLLAAPCYSAPAIAGDRLVVRNESTLGCWRLELR